MAMSDLLTHIEERDGRWVVSGDASGRCDGYDVPLCMGEKTVVTGTYRCGEQSVEICLRAVSATEYAGYAETLAADGWVMYSEHAISANRYATFTHPVGRTIHLGYYPALQDGTLRIVSEPSGYLPSPEKSPYTRVADTTFTQIGRAAVDLNTAPGMSYIMQLADGSFVLIDGGPANDDDERALWDYLQARTPTGQKPVIAAWFITHAHSDHMALANNFLTDYHDRVDVRLAAYNFPLYDAVKDARDVNNTPARYQPMIDRFIESIRTYWPSADHLLVHAGQRLYLADAEIEIIFTHEDVFPGEYTWVNHTSTAFRITVGGKSIMILGDCEKRLCQQMADTYGDYLKSDMLQLSHHGANGACLDLYRRIDPEICFWACSQTKFESDERMLGTKEGYDFNAYLRDTSIRVRSHYHSGATAIIPISSK